MVKAINDSRNSNKNYLSTFINKIVWNCGYRCDNKVHVIIKKLICKTLLILPVDVF